MKKTIGILLGIICTLFSLGMAYSQTFHTATLEGTNTWTMRNSFQGGWGSNGPGNYWIDSGVANAYTIAPSPVATSYQAGQTYWFKAGNANTTSSTIAVNGLGTKALTKNGAAALASGDIAANQVIHVVYDGTEFQVVGTIGGSASFTAGGDLSGTSSSQTVIGVNGAAVPLSALVLGTNGSRQLVAQALASTNFWVGNDSNLPAAVSARQRKN